jgi:hypothetical protein
MNKDDTRPPFSRPIKVAEIGEGATGEIEASKAEMAAIARLLELPALEGLSLVYRLRQGGGHRLRMAGRLKANVTQTCVVSLEPMQTCLDVPVEVEFWPVSLIEELEQRAEDPVSTGLLDWPEPIREDGTIDLGPVIYETLATALDPYPKREGVSFEWSQGASPTGEAAASGPFAALKRLKRS